VAQLLISLLGETRASGAKARSSLAFNGTAEAVPFHNPSPLREE
jgi:hypothetical protein